MTAIIDIIDELLKNRTKEVEDWLQAKRKFKRPYFYSSVDLRHSGVKLAPVDTNLFPAGFNNLSLAARERSTQLIKARFAAMQPVPQKVLIIPENHTRNLGYLENLSVLAELIGKAGVEVKIGNISITEPITLTSMSGKEIEQFPLVKNNHKVSTSNGFTPDLIILNNDCTAGEPEILTGITQPIEPSYEIGWYNRRKSEHFRAYEQIAREFAQDFNFDSWLISAAFHRCGVVNFREQQGIECVAIGVEKVLHTVRGKYQEYGIKEEPFVFIKADSGTYGMGIMTVKSGDELLELNKKTRNKMNVIKEGTQNTEVIIQEGIPTIDLIEGGFAEPMIYLLDGTPVGGAFRVNEERSATSNLNASGMRFVGMCDEAECEEDQHRVKVTNCNSCVFGLVATLATLAASDEVYGGLDIGFDI